MFRDVPEQNGLDILKIVVPPTQSTPDLDKSMAALLLRAQLEANAWNMQAGVEVWSPDGLTLRAAKILAKGEDVNVISRKDDHICSLRWVGNEAEQVEWLSSERYAWC